MTPDTPNIHPPIESRTTEQLLEIMETPEQWRDDVVLQTRTELLKRGITSEIQETRRKNRIKRDKRLKAIQANARYTTGEKIMIVLAGPWLIMILRDFFLFYSGPGYKTKNRQGFLYLFLGVLVWVAVLYGWFTFL